MILKWLIGNNEIIVILWQHLAYQLRNLQSGFLGQLPIEVNFNRNRNKRDPRPATGFLLRN